MNRLFLHMILIYLIYPKFFLWSPVAGSLILQSLYQEPKPIRKLNSTKPATQQLLWLFHGHVPLLSVALKTWRKWQHGVTGRKIRQVPGTRIMFPLLSNQYVNPCHHQIKDTAHAGTPLGKLKCIQISFLQDEF